MPPTASVELSVFRARDQRNTRGQGVVAAPTVDPGCSAALRHMGRVLPGEHRPGRVGVVNFRQPVLQFGEKSRRPIACSRCDRPEPLNLVGGCLSELESCRSWIVCYCPSFFRFSFRLPVGYRARACMSCHCRVGDRIRIALDSKTARHLSEKLAAKRRRPASATLSLSACAIRPPRQYSIGAP